MGKESEERKKIESLIKDIQPIRMSIKDIPQIASIFISYWGEMCLYSYEEFVRIVSQEISYIYKIDDEVIALCLMNFNEHKNLMEVVLLCVKKEFKGYHLGTSLLSFCINNCYQFGFSKFSLHVSTTNAPALSLYKNLGFEIIGFNRKYYRDEKPEDSNAYYMELNM